jgi:hypothetical protein
VNISPIRVVRDNLTALLGYEILLTLIATNVAVLLRLAVSLSSKRYTQSIVWELVSTNLFVVAPSALVMYVFDSTFGELLASLYVSGPIIATGLSLLTPIPLAMLEIRKGWIPTEAVVEIDDLQELVDQHTSSINKTSERIKQLASLEKTIQELERRFERQGSLEARLETIDSEFSKWQSQVNQLKQKPNLDLSKVEDRIQVLEYCVKKQTITNMDLGQRLYEMQSDLAGITESVKNLGKTVQTPPEFDPTEGMNHGSRVKDLLQRAFHNVNNPKLRPNIYDQLTEDQRSLKPLEYDVIAGVRKCERAEQPAYTSNIARYVRGLNHGEITNIAKHLVARGFLKSAQLAKTEWHTRGVPPIVYSWTERTMNIFLGSSTSASTGGSLHSIMELKLLDETILAPEPYLYLPIPQVPGSSRCDAAKVYRLNKMTWNWSDIVPANIETPGEVVSHSCADPDNEGQVYLNLITPFAVHAAKHLHVEILEESLAKLEELRSLLPSWLQKRVEIEIVSLDGN